MEPNPEIAERPKWQIDILLANLIGENIRVAAQSFSPFQWNGKIPIQLTTAPNLFLPDNSQAERFPLFIEGKLQTFVRTVGVVYVALDQARTPLQSANGFTFFRGTTAVILQGPAVVALAWPFRIERIPTSGHNYWEDIKAPMAQFTFRY